MIDLVKLRREVIRWILLVSLNSARASGGASETLLLYMIQTEYPDATPLEIRGQLDYLADRGLLKLDKKPDGTWLADINHHGVDVVEYSVDCEPGIARPKKTGLVA